MLNNILWTGLVFVGLSFCPLVTSCGSAASQSTASAAVSNYAALRSALASEPNLSTNITAALKLSPLTFFQGLLAVADPKGQVPEQLTAAIAPYETLGALLSAHGLTGAFLTEAEHAQAYGFFKSPDRSSVLLVRGLGVVTKLALYAFHPGVHHTPKAALALGALLSKPQPKPNSKGYNVNFTGVPADSSACINPFENWDDDGLAPGLATSPIGKPALTARQINQRIALSASAQQEAASKAASFLASDKVTEAEAITNFSLAYQLWKDKTRPSYRWSPPAAAD
jgi:hypothetical protein